MLSQHLIDSLFSPDLPEPEHWERRYPPRDLPEGAEVTRFSPSPTGFLHIGGDEPYGMPDQAYGDYVRRLKHAVRALGKRSAGWQESVRAGADPGHVIQYWMDASSLGAGAELPPAPEVTADPGTRPQGKSRRNAKAIDTAGLRCAPEILPMKRMMAITINAGATTAAVRLITPGNA